MNDPIEPDASDRLAVAVPIKLEEIQEAAIEALRARDAGDKMLKEGRAQWVEGMLGLAKQLHAAREFFPGNPGFSKWLQGSELCAIGKNDRAALVSMGEHLEETREALEQTGQRSPQHIWEKEIKPLLSPETDDPPQVRNMPAETKRGETVSEKPSSNKPKPKVSLTFPENEYRELEHLSAERACTVAELVHKAVRAFLADPPSMI